MAPHLKGTPVEGLSGLVIALVTEDDTEVVEITGQGRVLGRKLSFTDEERLT
jgi:hypothetical protein